MKTKSMGAAVNLAEKCAEANRRCEAADLAYEASKTKTDASLGLVQAGLEALSLATSPATIAARLARIEASIAPVKKAPDPVLIEEALSQHLARISGGESDSKKYQNQIPGVIRRLAGHARATHLQELTSENIDAHAEWLKTPRGEGGAGLAEKTRVNVKGILKEFFTFCHSKGWYEENPAEHLKLGKTSRQPVLFYCASEIDAVINIAIKQDKLDLAAVFGICCFAGPRLEEIHTIERSHIHLETRKLEVFDHKRKAYKVIPIFDPLMPILQKFLLSCGKKSKPFAESRSLDAFGTALARLVRRALPGRSAILYDAGGARLNAMLMARRTFSTHMRALGVSDRKVAQWSGHDAALDSTRYCGEIPDGEKPYPITFLGQALVREGIPCPFPEPGVIRG